MESVLGHAPSNESYTVQTLEMARVHYRRSIEILPCVAEQ
jgi:hypothetical protein